MQSGNFESGHTMPLLIPEPVWREWKISGVTADSLPELQAERAGFQVPVLMWLAVMLMIVGALLQPTRALAEEPKRFDPSSQDASTALRTAAIQGNFEILIPPKVVAGKKTNEVRGSYPPSVAFGKMLEGTGLAARTINGRGFVVEEGSGRTKPQDFGGRDSAPFEPL